MKKIFLLLLCFCILLIASCDLLIPTIEEQPKKDISTVVSVSDYRFDGKFVTTYRLSTNDGWHGEIYTFNGTNYATRYSRWDYDDDSRDYDNLFEYEIEVDQINHRFRYRLWNQMYASWSQWQKYEFYNNGNKLKLYSSTFKDYYDDYEKQ